LSRLRSETRLVLVVGAVVFADTLLYAVLAPILPQLTHELHLSKSSAGLLTAAYPIGTLVGSLPGGLLVMRIGPRATVLAGLALMALSSVAFGWLDSLVALDAARVVEGLGGACSWAGGLAWIVSAAPVSRRGALIGQAIGAAVFGSLFGPVLGTVASATGRPAAFTAFALLAALLVVWTAGLPAPERDEASLGGLFGALTDPAVLVAAWLVVLPAMASGAINVLGPLRLHRLGAGAVVIGACYLVAAGIETVISPLAGSVSDRRGRLLPLRAGLLAATVVLACFTLPRSVAVLALVIVLSAATLGMFWTPAMAMLTDAAQKHELHQGLAAALMNLAWAGGQILGSWAGGSVAKVAGDGVPMLTAAGLCALTFLTVRRLVRVRGLGTASPS
jgi:MFS family permease